MLNICVCAPKTDEPSETFIRAHVNRLPGKVTTVAGPMPDCTIAGRMLVPLAYRAAIRSPYRLPPQAVRIARYRANHYFVKALRRIGADVVLVEFGHHATGFLEACQTAKIPLVVHFHGCDAYHDELIARCECDYARVFRQAAAIIAVSPAMVKRLVELGASPGRIVCIPCGVDVEQFAPADPSVNPPLFVAVGRFVDKKAPYLTVAAFAKAQRACPAAKLLMVGAGPLLDCCKQLARALGVADCISFTGPLDHAEIRRLLPSARAFVQHSVTTTYGDAEGTPVAICEAGASGLPVVATRHAGIVDAVIDGETGFLTDELDVLAMTKFMIRLANDPDTAAAMGRRAREHIAQNFSMTSKIESLYRVLETAANRQALTSQLRNSPAQFSPESSSRT